MECVFESSTPSGKDVFVLIHEKKISSMKDLLPLLEQIAKLGKPCSSSLRTSKAKPSPPSW